ncbi:hypothetical protein DFQ28_001561 [Apophysomyces sp. BC1034]|nr:hypothetical protein DFQ30_001493 [Apophysomyces sp. BC1015]KAG0182526.1 hypothetical protein DFQ29_003752 [Apophysomyces sp. BC1021]KAG0194069.1 hypothetical protein DFQ28_001561 [Apophysomyces sp. BC1034]
MKSILIATLLALAGSVVAAPATNPVTAPGISAANTGAQDDGSSTNPGTQTGGSTADPNQIGPVSITQPLPGTTWSPGSTETVSWQNPKPGVDKLDIKLMNGPANALQPVVVLAQGVDASKGTAQVTVPSNVTTGSQYALAVGSDPSQMSYIGGLIIGDKAKDTGSAQPSQNPGQAAGNAPQNKNKRRDEHAAQLPAPTHATAKPNDHNGKKNGSKKDSKHKGDKNKDTNGQTPQNKNERRDENATTLSTPVNDTTKTNDHHRENNGSKNGSKEGSKNKGDEDKDTNDRTPQNKNERRDENATTLPTPAQGTTKTNDHNEKKNGSKNDPKKGSKNKGDKKKSEEHGAKNKNPQHGAKGIESTQAPGYGGQPGGSAGGLHRRVNSDKTHTKPPVPIEGNTQDGDKDHTGAPNIKPTGAVSPKHLKRQSQPSTTQSGSTTKSSTTPNAASLTTISSLALVVPMIVVMLAL